MSVPCKLRRQPPAIVFPIAVVSAHSCSHVDPAFMSRTPIEAYMRQQPRAGRGNWLRDSRLPVLDIGVKHTTALWHSSLASVL